MSPNDEPIRFCETCGAQLFPNLTFCHQCGMKIEPPKKEEIPPKKILPGQGLFKAYSVAANFRYQDNYYDNVKIHWFVTDRKSSPLPYGKAIENYDEIPFLEKVGPESFVNQCFTAQEVELLKHYLISTQKTKVVVEECPLPVKSTASGYRDTIPPPGTNFISLHKKSGYNLPFKVDGIFNLKMADERFMGDDHSKTVVSGINVKDIQRLIKEKEEQERKKGQAAGKKI